MSSGQTAELRENAARALANLPMCDPGNTQHIIKAGGVQARVRLLGKEYPYGCRTQACRAIGNMCVSSQVGWWGGGRVCAQVAARELRQAGAVQPLLAALLTEETLETDSEGLGLGCLKELQGPQFLQKHGFEAGFPVKSLAKRITNPS